MHDDSRSQTHAAGDACPFCAFWTTYKNSEAAKHVAGIQREGLLLMRTLLEGAIQAMEEQMKEQQPPASGCACEPEGTPPKS